MVSITLVLVVVAAAGVASARFVGDMLAEPSRRHRLERDAGTSPVSETSGGEPTASGSDDGLEPVFARVGGLAVRVPTQHLVALAYHEASYDDAMEMHPVGKMSSNANKTKFHAPPESPGPSYLVQASRGRGTGATTAVDVLMPRTAAAVAPVDGIVRAAKRYRLYGQYPDWRVEIEPSGHPALRVVMIHLDGVKVRRGDTVSATLSAIGTPRVFPFHSAVNDYVPGGDPHVHLEVKDLSAAPPKR